MTSSGPDFAAIIQGGLVADGAGGPPFRADIGVTGDRITAIGELTTARRRTTLDATGLVVAPGFIDLHSHSDVSLLVDPRAESGLLQGVTTEIVGHCGHGVAPISDTAQFRTNLYGSLPSLQLDWRDLPGYIARLEQSCPAVNVGVLVPNGNLRLWVLGPEARPATERERHAMRSLLAGMLDAGALGLSTGLEYPLEYQTDPADVLELCREVARVEGVYSTHTRRRGRGVVEATREAIAVARATGVRTQIAHALPRLDAGPGSSEAVVRMLEESARELDIAWDMHTRTFAVAGLGSVLASTAIDSNGSITRLASSIRSAVHSESGLLGSFARAGWDRVYLAGAQGQAPRSLEDLCDESGQDFARVLASAWIDGGPSREGITIQAQTYDEAGIAQIATSSRGMLASDAASQSRGGPYPGVILHGAFSWAAWTLRRLVRETSQLELADAVRRLTSMPAARAGLKRRGHVSVGAAADIVVFDPASISDRATIEDPLQPAVGVRHVLVNGQVAVMDKQLTGARAGQVLRAGASLT